MPLEIHRHDGYPRVLALAALDLVVIFLYCPLVDVEVRVDGINAHHFGQQGRIGLDQVTAGNELARSGPGGITIAATTSVKAMLAPGCPTGLAREVAGTVGIMSARISPYFTWHDLCKCKVRL